MKKPSILIVCPSYDQKLYTQTAFSIMETVVALREQKIDVVCRYLAGDAIVNRVRNGGVAEFLARKNMTHMLCVDSDMQFSPKTIFRLLQADVPFACAAYAQKLYRNTPTKVFQPRDLNSFHEATLVWNVTFSDPGIIEGTSRLTDVHGGFAKVVRVGAGLMLVRRDAIDAMTVRYPELRYSPDVEGYETPDLIGKFYGFFDPYLKNGKFVGEDYAFCDRWVEGCGGEIWCDLEAKIGHVGNHQFTGTLSDALTTHRNAAARLNGDSRPPQIVRGATSSEPSLHH